LTQRKVADDLGISQNYIPAIEAKSRQARANLQQKMARYSGCRFEDLFQVVLVDSETHRDPLPEPRR
jgi:DNA-binding XRE family transcriptional regulator